MNIYEREFIVLYNYYLKYGDDGSEGAIRSAKNGLTMLNMLFSFGLTILSIGAILGAAPSYVVEIIFSEYKAIPLVFILLIYASLLNRVTWKRLNFNQLCEKNKSIKTKTWWLAIYSGVFALSSMVLVTPVCSLSKTILRAFQ